MNFLSFNVNGVRAATKKTLQADLLSLDADVIGLQETKATVEQTQQALAGLSDQYEIYGAEAEKKGYSGTAVLTKKSPLNVAYGIGLPIHDNEGRTITLEFPELFFVTVYVPNASSQLRRLSYRTEEWDPAFREYLLALDVKKPVVVCGDFNVAHQAIDLKNPKSNYNRTPGYTQAEIDGMSAHIDAGLVDTFRHLYPEEVKYSWWSYRAGARARNVGWRLDYFLVSQRLLPKVADSRILNDVMGSDHCPVQLLLD